MSSPTTPSQTQTPKSNNGNCGERAKTSKPERRKKFYFTTTRPVSEKKIQEMNGDILTPYRPTNELKTLDDVKRYWEEEKSRKNREQEAKYTDHHTYRSRLSLGWKRERLFVADDDRLPGKSVVEDIDPEFFTLASGKPIKERKSIRQYREDVRNCFLTRLKIGYNFDQMLLMDEEHANEKKKFSEVEKKYQTCLKGFEAFLKEDHGTSSSLLETAKEETRKSEEKSKQLYELREKMKTLQVEVLVLEEKWRHSRMFQKFLYVVAPTEWRKVHDPYYEKESRGTITSDFRLFDSFREFPGSTNTDLEVKISKFKEDINEARALSLYFTDPQQLLNILEDLEKTNLRVLAHSNNLDVPAKKVLTEVERARILFDQDEKCLKEEITFLKHLITIEEEKTKSNQEKLREIAFGLFKQLITNEEYLTVLAYVEDAYEDAVSPNILNLGIVEMIKKIELKYESLLLALDNLPNVVVVRSIKKFFREEKKELEEAREAEKKVHQMEILLKRFSKALEKPKKGVKGRRMVRRSLPPEEIMFKYEVPKVLTKEERDYLFFFGETKDNELHKPLCP